MTPQEFVRKWKPVALSERAAAQEHFLDLCGLFDHPTPAQDDPTGARFTFEKGAPKTGGGDGFADVWKRGFFAWEYKKKKRDLDAALLQLVRYAAALENPPLHVVCDTDRFKIVTAWTNTVPQTHEFELGALPEPHNLRVLRAVFHDPDALRPKDTRASLTRKAADNFQTISDRLQHRNPDREAVAHFINQLVFCFFADSVKLLPNGLLKKLLTTAERRPHRAKDYFDKLFAEMERGGEFDLTEILWFNGGLFDGRRALVLEHGEIQLLFAAAGLDWSLIDPTIFGTLFERFLDPDKRAQIGAHYTDPDKIMMIVEPVILRPLRREWDEAKGGIEAIMTPVLAENGPNGRHASKGLEKRFGAARAKAEAARDAFIDRLCALRILDPACGSGNFLYLALQAVKDLEYRVILECEELLLGRAVPRVGPEILHGIEINPLAAELARTTIWIGDIQWRIRNAIFGHPQPILRKLDAIECRDALLAPDGKGGFAEADWPEADFIIGNPPFLGSKLMKKQLGLSYTASIRTTYAGRLRGFSDLVCYWFARAQSELVARRAKRAGLVATSSIRGGTNRHIMDSIGSTLVIQDAWSEQPWTIEGARVEVSLVCFCPPELRPSELHLDGQVVVHINPDLTSGIDLTRARPLPENRAGSFLGIQTSGPHDVAGDFARYLLTFPLNPNGRTNQTIIKPYWNGDDVAGRRRDRWLIDFPLGLSEADAALFEAPFEYLRTARYDPENEDDIRTLAEARSTARDEHARSRWWEPYWPRPEMRRKIEQVDRYIVTTETSQYRLFVWLKYPTLPDKNLIIIAREDDCTFGVLHSKFHEVWSLRLGTSLEDRPRYTSTTTFATYPFPEGLTPNVPASDYASDSRAKRIAAAAKKLDDLRRAWLDPSNLVDIVPEITPAAAPGEKPVRYPDRILPKTVEAAAKLRERTLTSLYNERPQWLADAHADLDRAVAAAYGWPEDIATEDALARLLEINLARAAATRGA